jgi:hypothetical protein
VDDFTARQLLHWVEAHYRDEDEQSAAFDAMRAVYLSDPEYYGNAGWESVRNAAREMNPAL